MRIIDILLALVRYSFLLALFIFIYFTYRMMMEDLALIQKNSHLKGKAANYFQLFVRDPGQGGNLNTNATFLVQEESTIGRDPDNVIVVNDPHVSAEHARLEVDGEELFLIDMGSTNGTFVNGRRIKGKKQLFPGDELIIGDVLFEVMGWENESSSAN